MGSPIHKTPPNFNNPMLSSSPQNHEDYGYDGCHASDADNEDGNLTPIGKGKKKPNRSLRPRKQFVEDDSETSAVPAATHRRKKTTGSSSTPNSARKATKSTKKDKSSKSASLSAALLEEAMNNPIGDDCEWSDALLILGTKELNEILKKGVYSLDQIGKLKAARRRAKNRTYALRSRQKKSGKDQTPCPGPNDGVGSDEDVMVSKKQRKVTPPSPIAKKNPLDLTIKIGMSPPPASPTPHNIAPSTTVIKPEPAPYHQGAPMKTEVDDMDVMNNDSIYLLSDDLLSESDLLSEGDDFDYFSSSTDTTDYDSMDSSPSLEFSGLSLAYDSDGRSQSGGSLSGSLPDSGMGSLPTDTNVTDQQVPVSEGLSLELESLMGELRNDYAKAHTKLDELTSQLNSNSTSNQAAMDRRRRSRSTTPTPIDMLNSLPASLQAEIKDSGLVNDLKSGFVNLHSKIDTWTREVNSLELLPSPPVLPSSSVNAFSFNETPSSMEIEISADSARARSLSLGGNSYDYFSAALLGMK